MPNYVKIEILRMLRNRRYIIFVVGFPVVFYLIFSGIWGAQTDSGGVRAAVVLMVSMAAYGAIAACLMSTAVPWAQERQSGWLRQLQVTPLPGWAIIVTKLIASLLLVLPSMVLVCLAAVLTQGVRLPVGEWLVLIPALWIGAVPFAALGLLLGSLLPADAAQSAAMISTFGLAILGGLWFPVEIMPEAMQSVVHAMPSFSYADIGQHLVAGGAAPPSAVLTVVAWAAVLGTAAVFAYRRALARA
ncbi:ABC transporter permease [Streptosporangium amethystogenes subsp. fukuiense]|uniref:ABC transporter permease n=1 Tax=Streptosporangium amethystogenes subsp. fukuiense TaxID=698418 RepID=A0ABW2T0D2_9ACTN